MIDIKSDFFGASDDMDEKDPQILLLTQINSMLTREDIVLGSDEEEINLEYYIFETSVNESRIANIIYEGIIKRIPLSKYFDISVKGNFANGTTRDIFLCDIYVNNEKKISFVIK